jgi:hypothetical protein
MHNSVLVISVWMAHVANWIRSDDLEEPNSSLTNQSSGNYGKSDGSLAQIGVNTVFPLLRKIFVSTNHVAVSRTL